MDNYDSTADTLKHIKKVNEYLIDFCINLMRRAQVHDNSKLEDPEKAAFDKYTPMLAGLTYGSPEYKDALNGLGPALKHHYENNPHHPEHHAKGINDMTLMDVVEMFFDWKAASERHSDGDMVKSIEMNEDRFGMSEQLADIFLNTNAEFFDE